jgi:hypothetical protein
MSERPVFSRGMRIFVEKPAGVMRFHMAPAGGGCALYAVQWVVHRCVLQAMWMVGGL